MVPLPYALTNCRVWTPQGTYDTISFSDVVESLGDVPPRGYDRLDLDGKFVMPGFVDAHLHIDEVGLKEILLDLSSARTVRDVLLLMEEERRKVGPGGWIVGMGLDHERLRERRFPTRRELDERFPSNPVLIMRTCLHVGVANSLALREAGVESESGLVCEDDFDRVRSCFLKGLNPREYADLIERACRKLLSSGVAACGTMSVSKNVLEALKILDSRGAPVRISAYLNPDLLGERYEGRRIFVRGIKFFADGSLGGHTAWLREPYSDMETRGILLWDEEKEEEALKAVEMGYQLAVHAIGDGALDVVLDFMERNGLRGQRIEHASLSPPDIVERMRSLGATAVIQPHFLDSDTWIVERLGERSKHAYVFRTLSEKMRVAFSTDSPVEPYDPLLTLRSAVTRPGPLGEINPDERMDVESALSCYTKESAEVCGFQSLKIGSPADLIVLSDDPRKNLNIKVEMVFLEGELVYSRRSGSKPVVKGS